jgi:thiol-disulfide isomerase/thioredoxin
MRKLCIFFFLLVAITLKSQIKGNLNNHINQELTLIGFNNLKQEILSVTSTDSLGNFTLIYPIDYKGMAILKTSDTSSLVFVLTEPNLNIYGSHLKEKESLIFKNGLENNIFFKYYKEYSQRQTVLSAWSYLSDKYQNEVLFKNQKETLSYINAELNRLEIEDENYLGSLKNETYMSWYLPLKKMVSNMPIIARHYKEKIPLAIQQFKSINFNNPKFKTSGLLKGLIEGHFMLLENSGQPLDSIYANINSSTKYVIENLSDNKDLLNKVGDYLFNYLKKRSLHESSEYLAVQLLSQNGCNLKIELTNKLESYRKLKPGKTAPDITFSNNTKLSNIAATKLLVFGSSLCSNCKQDVLKLSKYHQSWKQKGVKVVYISIDTNKTDFENYYKIFPWKTDTTYKGWESTSVKDYHVFATPTYFLLDEKLKILLRPKSIEQTDRWINLNKKNE